MSFKVLVTMPWFKDGPAPELECCVDALAIKNGRSRGDHLLLDPDVLL